MQMIERVARMIAAHQRKIDQDAAIEAGCDINLVIDGYMPWARDIAKLAIEALREPTGRMEYMMDSWLGAMPHDGFGKQRWQQLIDAALQESEEKSE